MTSGKPIRVLIADQNQMACRLLSHALEKEPEIEIAANAATYQALIHLSRTTQPDVALISATLPGGPLSWKSNDGGHPLPPCPWVMLLDDADSAVVVAAFRAGARGVFCRSQSDIQLLAKCVRRVNEGQVWADSTQMGYLLDAVTGLDPTQHSAGGTPPRLTGREESIVRLVVQGLVNREIAAELHLSEHTVKNYLFRIFDKLGVSNRVELALYAVARLHLESDIAA